MLKVKSGNIEMLNVILSREDYAGIVGTVTESAIRVLSKFKKEGYISYYRQADKN
jgi:hypothetical protein